MKKTFIPVLLGAVAVMTGAVACGAPNNDTASMSDNPEAAELSENDPGQVEAEQAPAEDPMANEEDPMAGEAQMMSDTEIQDTVRENLVTQYPNSTFNITSEEGKVTIVSDDLSPEEMDAIQEQVADMSGVKSVEVKSSSDAAM